MSGPDETIFDDSRPVGMDVANSLKARIFAGEYRPGDILSSYVRILMAPFGRPLISGF